MLRNISVLIGVPIVILFVLYLTAFGLKQTEQPKVKIGPLDQPVIGETLTEDDRFIGKPLPPESTNIEYLGNGWVKFDYQGTTFLLADHGRGAVMASFSE